ncbi:hypothetical protein ABT034_10415 [Streptomyces sp. NPDC002773]|uniref:hypothetical protein n=1 Tax=Streptomyces sp. NPDC002773 TaxID=3154430 RepID=UPI00331768D8
MATTIPELSAEIAALKSSLTTPKDHEPSKVEFHYDGDHQGKTKEERDGKKEKHYVSALKKALIDEEPKIITTHLLPFEFTKRFAEMYEELQKEKSSELLEAFGLDGFAAAWEKFKEGHEARWEYMRWAVAGIIVPMTIGALVLVFRKAILEGFRQLQYKMPGLGGKAVTLNERQTWFTRMTKDQIRGRDDAALGIGQTETRNPADLDPLKEALGQVNRRIINFNKAIRQMKSASALKKLAGGVEAVTKATDAAKPTDIETLAKAIDKLGDAQDKFDPKKLPKARGLASAATEANRLADAGNAVKLAFDNLKAAAQAAERVIATG